MHQVANVEHGTARDSGCRRRPKKHSDASSFAGIKITPHIFSHSSSAVPPPRPGGFRPALRLSHDGFQHDPVSSAVRSVILSEAAIVLSKGKGRDATATRIASGKLPTFETAVQRNGCGCVAVAGQQRHRACQRPKRASWKSWKFHKGGLL